MNNIIKLISAKLKYKYLSLILKYKYDMKPNEYGSFDMKVSPAFEGAILKRIDEDERKFSKDELKQAYNDGCPISWNDYGVTMKDKSFDDWFKRNYE